MSVLLPLCPSSSVCLSAWLAVCFFVCLAGCLFVWMFVCLSAASLFLVCMFALLCRPAPSWKTWQGEANRPDVACQPGRGAKNRKKKREVQYRHACAHSHFMSCEDNSVCTCVHACMHKCVNTDTYMYIDMYMHLPECSGATFYSALFGKFICTVAISVPFSLGGRAFSPLRGKATRFDLFFCAAASCLVFALTLTQHICNKCRTAWDCVDCLQRLHTKQRVGPYLKRPSRLVFNNDNNDMSLPT